MRQVPENLSYLLIGSGRLARHLSSYFDALKISFNTWNRKQNTLSNLSEKLQKHSVVLLCISDDQIEDFFDTYQTSSQTYVHFSGSFEHSEIVGFHPLMTFGDSLFPLDSYQHIHFVGSHPEKLFRALFPKLPNRYHQIAPEQKALYHSLCVLSGNGTVLLWELVEREFAKLNLPPEAFQLYRQQIFKNIEQQTPGRFTGPWFRQDQNTVDTNRRSLEENPLLPIYNELQQLAQLIGK